MTNVGILHQMWAVPGISDRQCILDAAEDVRLAEALGYESFWFGEHHFNRDKKFFGRVPVPELLIARLASETRRIRLGTGVKVLPLDSAARFAEKMALLDLLTDRRANFGIGEGTKGPLACAPVTHRSCSRTPPVAGTRVSKSTSRGRRCSYPCPTTLIRQTGNGLKRTSARARRSRIRARRPVRECDAGP